MLARQSARRMALTLTCVVAFFALTNAANAADSMGVARLAKSGGAAGIAPCVAPAYTCLPDGKFQRAISNGSQVCTETHDVDWGDGSSSSYTLRPGATRTGEHRYDTSHHHLFTATEDVSGTSSDPKQSCAPRHLRARFEIPGPAVEPCVPARNPEADCDRRGIEKGEPLLDQFLTIGRATLDFLLLDDLRTLQDPTASAHEKGLIIASYLIPQGKLAALGEKALVRLGTRFAPALVEGFRRAEREMATRCFMSAPGCGKPFIRQTREAVEDSLATPDAQEAITAAFLKPGGEWLGEKGMGAREVDAGAYAAKELFRELSRLGDTRVIKTPISDTKTKKIFLSTLPNGDQVKFRSFSKSRTDGTAPGPTIEYFVKTTGRWTKFHFKK